MTVRKMRQDERLVFDAIDSELERFGVPLGNATLISRVKRGIASLETSCNTSCRVEVHVGDEDVYYADVKKNILVPWIRVEIYKKETDTQNDEHPNSEK